MNDSFTNTRYTPEAKAYELATREEREMTQCNGGAECWHIVLKDGKPAHKHERSEMTHTPGPWKLGEEGEVVTDSPNEYLIATAHHSRAQVDANARLIAAAPALLEALEALVDIIQRAPDAATLAGNLNTGIVFDLTRDAIALARGEEVTT